MAILKQFYKNYPILLLLILGVLVFVSNLDVLMVNIMEARNFIAAREMLTHNNWIFTTMNETARYEKPPLPTWLSAISVWVLGIENVFAYRLPAALASIFLMITFYRLQLLLEIKKSIAFGSTLILITSFYIVFSGRDGQWDIFTHAFMLGCCYFLIRIFQNKKDLYLNAIIAGLFFGASLLSKGPVSLYALFLPFLISYGWVYKYAELKYLWKPLLLFLIIGLVSGSWWILLVHYYDAEAFAEIAEVESGRWFNYNVRPIWYYWSFFVQSGVWTIPAFIGLGYWYLKGKVSNLKAYTFYFIWTVASVILLSVIPEKKSRYLLPVLIPLAMTTGFYVEYIIKNFKLKLSKIERFPIYVNFILLSIIAIATPFVLYFFFGQMIWEETASYILFSIVMLIIGITIILGLIKKIPKLLFGMQFLMILAILNFGFPLVTLISPYRNQPNISQLKNYQEQHNLEVYDASGTFPELIFEYGKPIMLVHSQEALPAEAKKTFGLLVSPEANPEWVEKFKNYDTTFINTYNLNPHLSKKQNGRLIRKFYVLSKK